MNSVTRYSNYSHTTSYHVTSKESYRISAPRNEWSGIKILELIFNEIDAYKTVNVLVENKFHALQFMGCGKVSELLSMKKKLFERLPTETQTMLNSGKPLEEEIQKTFMLSGREFSSNEKIQYQGLAASVLR